MTLRGPGLCTLSGALITHTNTCKICSVNSPLRDLPRVRWQRDDDNDNDDNGDNGDNDMDIDDDDDDEHDEG